jgi:hypothetical protein
VEGKLHTFVTYLLLGDEWSSSRFYRFIQDTPWPEDSVVPRAGPDVLAKREIIPVPTGNTVSTLQVAVSLAPRLMMMIMVIMIT